MAAEDHSELNWLEMLRAHLPRRYAVDRAFLLDATGRKSEQIAEVVVRGRAGTKPEGPWKAGPRHLAGLLVSGGDDDGS